MKKLLASLLILTALGMSFDASAWGRGGRCGKSCAPCVTDSCEIPECYVERIVEEKVAPLGQTVYWCPPGSMQRNCGAKLRCK